MRETHQIEKLNSFERAARNEAEVLRFLGEYSWLTTHQVGWLVFGKSSNSLALAKRLLFRMRENMLIEHDELSTQKKFVLGWFLIDAGRERLLEENPRASVNGYIGDGRFVQEKGYVYISAKDVYHRFLCNSFLIGLRDGYVELNPNSGNWEPIDHFTKHPERTFIQIPEAKIQSNSGRFLRAFGCEPDCVIKNSDTLISIELENTARGPANHKKKLYSFLDSYLDRMKQNGFYSDHFDEIPEIGEFSELFVVFVCSNEKAFRNIYRHVERAMQKKEGVDAACESISYLISRNKPATENWTSPFESYDYLRHYDADWREEEGRTRHLRDDDDKRDILQQRIANAWTIEQLAAEHNIHRATISRWNKQFKVW